MSAPDFITNNFGLFTRYFVGNLEYVLLITSMLMTRMLLLRVFAISSGFVGAGYSFFWLRDPVGTLWEMAFTLVNVGQIALITYRNRLSRFNDEERTFYTHVVPTLAPFQARRLLQAGVWRDGRPGTELTRQGEPVSHLIFLMLGEATVFVDGRCIGNCNEGDLIGDISIRTGKPATATVIARAPIRYLALERQALRRVMKADPEIALAVDVSNRLDLESKLVRMNQAALQHVA
jgi:CRP-like cAMP-binding protein